MKKYDLISLGDLLASGVGEEELLPVFEKFTCEREKDLEKFLTVNAIRYEDKGIGKTFLFLNSEKLQNGEMSIMAYYTISHSVLDISNLSQRSRKKMLGNYPGRDRIKHISTFLIGQIGRNDEYTADDLDGDTMFRECYHSLSLAAKIVGGYIISLECREHMYSKVYEGKGFSKLSDDLNENNLYDLYRKIDFTEYWNQDILEAESNEEQYVANM